MENSGPTKEFTILDQDGEPAGNGWISSFCLDLDIKSDGFPSYNALIQAVQLIQTDGTAIPASGYNCGSFGGTASARWRFRQLIDLEQIKSIQIGDQYSASLVE